METAPYLMQKASFCEDSFWEARGKSRHNLVSAVVISSVLLLLLDAEHTGIQILSVIGLWIFHKFINTNNLSGHEKFHRLAYNILISLICIVGFLIFIGTTLGWFGDISNQIIGRIILKRMHNGEIISVSLLFLILPLIATPGGMDVIWAKTVTLINLFLFLIHTYLMYEKGKSNELITNPDDLMKLHPTCNCSPIDPYMRDIGIIHDIIIILGLFYLCWKSCALSADIGRSGDLVLNHNLKNSIAGAACLLELDNIEQNGSLDLRNRQKQVLNQLYRTMRWCTMRQVMVDVADGTYQSVLSPINVQDFLHAIANDNMGVSFEIKENDDDFKHESVVLFDEQMVRLAMENAISNAIVHGDGSSIVLGASLQHDKKGMFALYVENQISNSSHVTNEKLIEICKKAKSSTYSSLISSSSPLDYMSSSSSNIQEPIQEDNYITEESVKDITTKMNLSTRSGMRHIDVACGGAGGSFDLELKETSQKKCVVLTCYFPVEVIENEINETTSALKNTLNHQKSSFNSSSNSSNNSSSVLSSSSSASSSFTSNPTATIVKNDMIPNKLKVCAIDDSELICKGYSKLLLSSLKADVNNSFVCCPKTRSDVNSFINKVMDSDICILDQHIELNGSNNTERAVLGTDIARELDERHFQGLVLIRSANSSELDALEYMADGTVHATLGKAESHKDMAAKICIAFAQHKRKHIDDDGGDGQPSHENRQNKKSRMLK